MRLLLNLLEDFDSRLREKAGSLRKKITSFFSSAKETAENGISGAGAAATNVRHYILSIILGAVHEVSALIMLIIKIAVAALGIAVIVFLRNLSNAFGTPGSNAWIFGNTAFGFLGLQWLGYIAYDILGKANLAGRINIASFVYLGVGLVMTFKGTGVFSALRR